MASGNLWTPEGVSHNGITAIMPPVMETTYPQAHVYTFTFRYKGKEKMIQVVAHADVTRDEVEDRAGKAFEDWIYDLDQQEHKRPPTAEEKKQIGKAMNEFYQSAKRRRASSNNTIYFGGIN